MKGAENKYLRTMGRIFGPAVEKAMPVMLKVALGSVGVLFVAAVTEITALLITVYKRLKEPVDITDPILAQDLTRDTCIYGALAKSMEACREMKVQKESIHRLSEYILLTLNQLMTLKNIQADLTNNSAGIHRLYKEQALIRIIIVVSCLLKIVFVILVN